MIEILNGMYETIRYCDLSQFRMYHNKEEEDYPNHWHVGIEIIMPLTNKYSVFIQEEEIVLYENDIIIINTGVIHALKAPPVGERIIIQFDISLLNILKEFETLIFMLPQKMVFRSKQDLKIYEIIYNKLRTIIKEYDENKTFHEAFIYAKLIEIYGELARREMYQGMTTSDTRLVKQQSYIKSILKTCDYINSHYMENLTLEKVAKISGFSKYHFSRVFKQFMNKTFYQYLNQKRIKQAILLLSNQEMSITQIAMECGFKSISTFNRTFKEMNGRSPSAYRDSWYKSITKTREHGGTHG